MGIIVRKPKNIILNYGLISYFLFLDRKKNTYYSIDPLFPEICFRSNILEDTNNSFSSS